MSETIPATDEKTVAPVPVFARAPLSRYLILALVVLGTWISATPGDFVWIDHVEIEEGGYRIESAADFGSVWRLSLDQYLERREGGLAVEGGYFRPLYALSISLDWAAWGARPWCYHVENLVWHFFVVCGLFGMGRRMLRNNDHGDGVAFWSALIFAVHPLGVHSVTWISGRKDLMCVAFSVFSWLALWQAGFGVAPHCSTATLRRSAWIGASALFFVLAVLSKELAFVVPIFATVWYWLETRGNRSPEVAMGHVFGWMGVALLGICTFLALAYRGVVLGGVGLAMDYPASSLVGNVGTFSGLWWCYVGRVVFPFNPSIVDRWPISHDLGWVGSLAMLGLIVVVILLVIGVARRWQWTVFLLWYVVWMLPASGLVPLRHLYAERYLYPASWGLVVLGVLILFGTLSREQPAFRQVLLCGIAGTLATTTALENRFWWNDLALLSHAIEQDPRYVEGRLGLATIALREEEIEKAAEHSQIAIDAAKDPGYASYWSPFVAHTNLGVALQRLRQFEQAEWHFEQASKARPGNAISHYHLGLNALALGDPRAAVGHFERALELRPGDYLSRCNLAYAYLILKRFTDSIELLEPLVAMRPADVKNRENLGSAYLLAGRFGEAEREFAAIVENRPTSAENLAKLAWAEWELKKADEALKHLLAAVEIAPEQVTVRHVAGIVLGNRKQQPPPTPADGEGQRSRSIHSVPQDRLLK